MLRSLVNFGNERLLRPFDLRIVRRSRVPFFSNDIDSNDRRIAFFHPPKCGGTSVYRWLTTTLGGSAGLDPIAADAAAANLDLTTVELREVILAYFVQRTDARLICGHHAYSRRAFEGHEDAFDMITILRNPLDRLLSNYYFNRFRKQRDHCPIDLELSDWLSTSEARRAGTTFARTFVGDITVAAALDRHGDWHDLRSAAASAVDNLKRFAIVGTLERLQDFEMAVRERYGIKGKIRHLRKNPQARYPKFTDQPAAIQERIQALCEPDMAIYDKFAQARSEATPTLAATVQMAQ